jgi:flagellar protein FlaG
MNLQPIGSNALTSMLAQRPQNAAPAPNAAADKADKPVQSQSTVSASEARSEPVSREQLNQAIKATKDFVGSINSSLDFSVDEDTGSVVVKVIDKETKEVIRQFPSEEMLSIAKALDSIKGLLVKQKA